MLAWKCGNGAFAFECDEPNVILNRWPGILTTLMEVSNPLCGSLRISAASALKYPVNAENAEIRREPQRNTDLVRRYCLVYSACRDDPPVQTPTAFGGGDFHFRDN